MAFNIGVWVEKANADNAVATATRAAQAGRKHYIEAITGSYGLSKSGILTIKDGDTVIYEFIVYDTEHIEFPRPIPITRGNAVHVELTASGAGGTIGYVNMVGVTR